MNKEMERLVKRSITGDTANIIAQGIKNYVLVKECPIVIVEEIGHINDIKVYAVKNIKKEVIDSFTAENRLYEILNNMERRYGFKVEVETEENGGIEKFKLYPSNY